MHPSLFSIGSFSVPSYGMMLALSFLSGLLLSMRLAKKRGLNPDIISDFGVYLILSSIVGARLYYAITHFDEFYGPSGAGLLAIINPFHGGQIGISGLVMYGGFIAAIITGYLFFKIKKVPPLPYLDSLAPHVGIGIALTRIGCFLNGCCYGLARKAGDLLSINYPIEIGSPASNFQHYHVHAPGLFPSQFLESLGGIAIFVILVFVGRSKYYFAGLQFYLMIVLYAVLRFFVEMTRFIEVPKILGLSHNQIICIVTFAVFSYIIYKKHAAQQSGLKVNAK